MDETGAKITALDPLTDGASDDLLAIVDVSDNDVGAGAMSVDGTDKKMTLANLLATLRTLGLPPAGVVSAYGGSSAPTGYLLCDGSAVSRTTYSALFTAIGTAYGAGDGSTTFNVPNLKGRVPAGYDSSQTEFNALGKTGGEKTHTLTVAEMPEHRHTVSDFPTNTAGNEWVGAAGTAAKTSKVSSYAGSSSAHNNLQPYITLNYIIKT